MKLNWGNAIVIFFALFLSLAAVFIVFSLRQHNDLVDDDYYEKGAAYSKQIEINVRSAIFMDSITISNQGEQINIECCESVAKNASEIEVFFYRPSEKLGDYKILIDSNTDNFNIDKSHLRKGRYIVKMTWENDAKTYAIEKDLFVE